MNSPLPAPASDTAVTVAELRALIGKVTLLDVRRPAALERSPRKIPGAEWRDPEQVAAWAAAVTSGRPVVVYCVHGHEVSRFVAGSLRVRGYDVRFLIGGIEAWQKEIGELS